MTVALFFQFLPRSCPRSLEPRWLESVECERPKHRLPGSWFSRPPRPTTSLARSVYALGTSAALLRRRAVPVVSNYAGSQARRPERAGGCIGSVNPIEKAGRVRGMRTERSHQPILLVLICRPAECRCTRTTSLPAASPIPSRVTMALQQRTTVPP